MQKGPSWACLGLLQLGMGLTQLSQPLQRLAERPPLRSPWELGISF